MGESGKRLREWAASLKREIRALWFAIRDPETPWYARAIGAVVVAYAISPIDLIPDFIPILGYLDDLILLPLGLALLRRLIPEPVMARARAKAAEKLADKRLVSWGAAAFIVSLWLIFLVYILIQIFRR